MADAPNTGDSLTNWVIGIMTTVIVFLSGLIGRLYYKQTTDESEEKTTLQQEIDELKKELKATNATVLALSTELSATKAMLGSAQERIRQLESEMPKKQNRTSINRRMPPT